MQSKVRLLMEKLHMGQAQILNLNQEKIQSSQRMTQMDHKMAQMDQKMTQMDFELTETKRELLVVRQKVTILESTLTHINQLSQPSILRAIMVSSIPMVDYLTFF